MKSQLHLAALTLAVTTGMAVAADCDFDTPKGSCTGTVKIVRSSGSAPSYAAELLVTSSAPRCSRVDYYVNSTPYQTVLANKRSDHESVFGTSPVSAKDIAISKCTSFASASARTDSQSEPKSASGDFGGRWTGSVQWLFVSDPTELTINAHGSSASGVWHSGRGNASVSFNGTASGNVMRFQYVAPGDGSHGSATMTLTGPNSATITFAAAPATFSGTLTRR
ncbi:hypothetical protein [uncultured Bosea sp.]|uniref:hypothetical protein n=1 Tax=uncultured Bosea sp. TaxID=211457 RepID=UPI0025E9DBD4|nr:hypothetical protein [uncultured Bosea sp.]